VILVTGATGKIGSEVVQRLSAKGVAVRALVRNPDKAKNWKGVEIAKGDFDDISTVDAALKGVDTLFLLTIANPKQESAVLEAGKRAGVKRVVKISALGADTASKLTLARGHGAVEEQLRASGLKWTILRPGMFTQNFLNYADTIRSQGQFFGSYGEGKVAPIDVRDIAEVAVLALLDGKHDGKTYALTGKDLITHADAATKLSAALGKPVKYVNLPLAATRKALEEGPGRAGMPAWFIEDLLLMQDNTAQNRSAMTTNEFEQLTGHAPRTFDDFARDYASSFR
jgi:uncharacterized protein YbjT (DUF2867 family)